MCGKGSLYPHFTSLSHSHFPLLRQWLNQPHVKEWWDKDILWTDKRIREKYGTYVKGYKVVGNTKKPIHAAIMFLDETPVGYIQYYNAYDFPDGERDALQGLPQSLAAVDFYIGNPDFVGRGLSPLLLTEFLQQHVWQKFKACLADPDSANTIAIRVYEKAGFKTLKTSQAGKMTWMLKKAQI